MPNKTGARLPHNLTSFDAVSSTRTLFVPGPAFGTNGTTSGVFTRPAIDSFGTVGRNNYFGPNYFNDDLSILKNIPIKESIQGQFRMDAFNVFNHINAGNPSSSCIDCTISSNAGVITGMAVGANPRQLEFSASIHF